MPFRDVHMWSAEVNLLKSIPFIKLNGRDIIVIRVNKNGRLRNSRPCNDCIDILKKLIEQAIPIVDRNIEKADNIDLYSISETLETILEDLNYIDDFEVYEDDEE